MRKGKTLMKGNRENELLSTEALLKEVKKVNRGIEIIPVKTKRKIFNPMEVNQ